MSEVLNINIIGNGFDKMHGVDSTYDDFLSFCATTYPNAKNHIYLGMEEETQNNSWVDCEQYLNRLFNGFKQFKGNLLEVNVKDADVITFINYTISKYGKIIEYDRNSRRYSLNLGEFLVIEKHYDFKPISNEFVISNGTGLQFLVEKIEQQLLDEFYELKQILTNYLKDVECNFEKNSKFLNKVFYPMRDENIVTLSFNYTSTGYTYFDNVYHLHGNLSDENIVWGYYGCESENICKNWQISCVNAGSKFKEHITSELQRARKINLNIIGHSVCENDYIQMVNE